MKILFFYPLLLLWVSCSTLSSPEKNLNSSEDILSLESFSRLDFATLSKLTQVTTNEKTVIECRKNNFGKIEKKQRTEALTKSDNFYYWNSVSLCLYLDDDYDLGLNYLFYAKPSNEDEQAILNNNIAVLLFAKKDFHQAFYYLKLSSKNSKLITPKYNLAKFMVTFNMYQNAIELIEQIPNAKADKYLQYLIAYSLIMDNKYSDLIKLKLSDTDADGKTLQAYAHFVFKNSDLALSLLSKIDKEKIFYQKETYKKLIQHIKKTKENEKK
jgi:hypothetical protein